MRIKIAILLVAVLLCSTAVYWAVGHQQADGEKVDVDPKQLLELIDRADRLVVLERPERDSRTLYESSERGDLDALKSALKLSPPKEPVHCMCLGEPIILLYEDGTQIGEIRNHHAVLVRTNLWKSDALITDREAYLAWFDERKITAPRDEVNQEKQRQEQFARDRQRWLEAAPDSVRPLLPEVEKASSPGMAEFKPSKPREGGAAGEPERDPKLSPLREAMAEQFAEEQDRILALFSWFGSGAGPWSGYPSYESIAEQLLMEYRTEQLLSAIEDRELSIDQLEGVARLFGGWDFRSKRPDDLTLLPADLKKSLLEHSLKSDNEDKRGRAQSAFGS